MTFELLFDAFQGLFGALVARLDALGGDFQLFEQSGQEAALILAALHAVHGDDHLHQQVADLAGVLGFDVLQGLGRDRRALLLHRRAVVGDDLGLVQVDALCKRLYLRLFLRGKLFHLAEHLLCRDNRLVCFGSCRYLRGIGAVQH